MNEAAGCGFRALLRLMFGKSLRPAWNKEQDDESFRRLRQLLYDFEGDEPIADILEYFAYQNVVLAECSRSPYDQGAFETEAGILARHAAELRRELLLAWKDEDLR
ncbi:MAG TPA: hypothetical protein VH022_14335 [Candidatus Acidoferrum sp.]|jgi:hypothetical protein|nr:hypothetical protein [Candidatus Acidoferrum sp.]